MKKFIAGLLLFVLISGVVFAAVTAPSGFIPLNADPLQWFGPTGSGFVAQSGGVVLDAGRWLGSSAQIAEGTTNLHTNPSLETDSIGYGSPYRVTFSRSSERSRYGSYSAKWVAGDPAGSWYGTTCDDLTGIDVSPSTTYIASAWVYVEAGNTGIVRLEIVERDGSGSPTGNTWSGGWSSGSGWQRLAVSFTTTANGEYLGFRLRGSGNSAPGDIYFTDAHQVEAKAYPTPYCDGSLGDGHSWSGTPHASTSTREPATIHLDAAEEAGLSPSAGSISLWWAPYNDSTYPNDRFIFDTGGSSFWAYYESDDDTYRFGDGTNGVTASASFDANQWQWLDFEWDNTGLYLYRNNTLFVSGTTFTTPTLGADLYIGTDTSGNNHANARFNQVLVFDRRLSDSERSAFFNRDISAWNDAIDVLDWVDQIELLSSQSMQMAELRAEVEELRMGQVPSATMVLTTTSGSVWTLTRSYTYGEAATVICLIVLIGVVVWSQVHKLAVGK